MPWVPLHHTWHIYPPQSSIDVLSTITPQMADLPPQPSTDVLKTITPNLADLPPTLEHRSLDIILRNMQFHIDGEYAYLVLRNMEIVPFQLSLSLSLPPSPPLSLSLSLSLSLCLSFSTTSRSANSSKWPFLISIVKADTIKLQIYPHEVFYAKDLLPTRVAIYLYMLSMFYKSIYIEVCVYIQLTDI